jgi:hypothetical protein
MKKVCFIKMIITNNKIETSFLKSISEQDLVNVVHRNQKSRFGFVKKPGELAGMIGNCNQ